ncbi:MAG: phosphoribosylaminoimidazolesuccinocarboxamide synthase [Bacteroidales bacterium]|nr:phosphoribosylaminoimidazolesuccinocarboxamide synthase [Bacteroidales bacterium]
MEIITEGHSKIIYAKESPDKILVYFKDTATAFHNIKRAKIVGKGLYVNQISAILFQYLTDAGIRNHFIKLADDQSMECLKTDVLPLRVIVRNFAAGSLSSRFGIKEETPLVEPIYEMTYKSEDLDNPFMNEHIAVALGFVTYNEMTTISDIAHKANTALSQVFESCDIRLIDFKLEFGRLPGGELIIADEISPDTCRLVDIKTGRHLDKDRFRHDMGDIIEAYNTVLIRLKQWKNLI